MISLRSREYQYNITTVKKYNADNYKLTTHKFLKVKGVENPDRALSVRGTVNDKKIAESISRAKSKIFEYALCNEFEYFITLTLDPQKYDRSDLEKYIKNLGQFVRDYRKKHDIDIQYLLIPELHKDGENWHMHGLIRGVPLEHFEKFTLQDKITFKMKKMIKDGRILYNWIPYFGKFGFCSIEKVKDQESCAKYITKYIGKNLGKNIDLNKKLYYCTKGLKTAEIIKKGAMSANITPDFENDYVSITWFDEKNIRFVMETIL